MRTSVSAILAIVVLGVPALSAAPVFAAPRCNDALVRRLSAQQPHWKPLDEPSHRAALQLAHAANDCRAAHENDPSAIGYALRAAAAYTSAGIAATSDDDRRAARRAADAINRGVKKVDNSLKH